MLSSTTLNRIDAILEWHQVNLNHACYMHDPNIANQLKEVGRLREILRDEMAGKNKTEEEAVHA